MRAFFIRLQIPFIYSNYRIPLAFRPRFMFGEHVMINLINKKETLVKLIYENPSLSNDCVQTNGVNIVQLAIDAKNLIEENLRLTNKFLLLENRELAAVQYAREIIKDGQKEVQNIVNEILESDTFYLDNEQSIRDAVTNHCDDCLEDLVSDEIERQLSKTLDDAIEAQVKELATARIDLDGEPFEEKVHEIVRDLINDGSITINLDHHL